MVILLIASATGTSGIACRGNRVWDGADAVVLDHVPQVAYPVLGDFNAMVVYRGVDVTPAVARPGQPLKLTHLWEIMSPPGEGWKVVTRLQGKSQPEIVADHDAAKGLYPVARWQRGDIVRDQHEVTLPLGWADPTVTVVVGLVNGPARLPIVAGPAQNENHLVAATIQVEPAPTVSP
jgi:hypothetical protein